MHMHTLGWGRYKWRYAPAEAEGEREAGAEGEGEMGPSRSSRSSQHGGGEGGWFVAEVKVQPTDLVTQYGTFEKVSRWKMENDVGSTAPISRDACVVVCLFVDYLVHTWIC